MSFAFLLLLFFSSFFLLAETNEELTVSTNQNWNFKPSLETISSEEIKFLNEISLKLNETRYDYDIINFDQNHYEIEWTLEEVGNLDSKKTIAKDLLTFDSNIGSIIEFGDDEYLSKDIRTKFNYEFVDRIINISGNFEIEGFENKEILLQLLNSGEIFKGEKRLNDKKGIAHKIKVKIKKI